MKIKILLAAFLGWLTAMPMVANAWDCKLAEGVWGFTYKIFSGNGLTGTGIDDSVNITVKGQQVTVPNMTVNYSEIRQGATVASDTFNEPGYSADCNEWTKTWGISDDLMEMRLSLTNAKGYKSWKRISPLPSLSQNNSNRNPTSNNTNSGNTPYGSSSGNASGNGTPYGLSLIHI